MDIEKVLFEMIRYFKTDMRRINHAIKVFLFARLIGKMEGLDDSKQQVLEIAAVLHDIGIKVCEQKYNSVAGHLQEIEGPKVAEDILRNFDIDQKTLERVLFLIGNHHSYQKIDDIDFQILVESDFIVNIHEDGLSKDAVKTIKEKYFKTKTSVALLETMFEV